MKHFNLTFGKSLVLVIIGLFLLSCTCIGEASLKESIKESDIIFKGRVVSDTTFEVQTYVSGLKISYKAYLFEAQQLYKEKTKGTNDSIYIFTGEGSGDCGYRFLEDTNYIVFAKYVKLDPEPALSSTRDYLKKRGKVLYTSICMRTALYHPHEEEKVMAHMK